MVNATINSAIFDASFVMVNSTIFDGRPLVI